MSSAIEEGKRFSTEKLQQLRGVLQDVGDNTFTIVVGGSIARLEASGHSDVDYFFFGDDDLAVQKAKDFLTSKSSAITRLGLSAPASGGAFGPKACETHDILLSNIGGQNDNNDKITRRILFLLEGDWLTGESKFKEYRRHVIERYTPEHIRRDKICRFLLNDVIRYYRTICVDFEHKTVEGGKPWGLRYVKLRFSRKLLYFGGVIAIAETAGLDRVEKIERLGSLFEMPPIGRMTSVFGDMSQQASITYGKFMEQMAQKKVRDELNRITEDLNTHSAVFKELKLLSRQFTQQLHELLIAKYSSDHPIHKALLF